MKWLNWFGKSSTPVESQKSDPPMTLDDIFNQSSDSMSQVGSLKIEAFYSCVRDKSETIGQLPLRLYRYAPDGSRSIMSGNRLNRIFTRKPNDYQTMMDFVQMVVTSIETIGAFYAYKERNDRGNVMSIIPFFNQRNVHASADVNGNIYYNYVYNDGKVGDPYHADDLIIIKNFTLDGYTPVSPIVYMATILGIADAQEQSYKELQTEGITAQMALGTDGVFNDTNAIKRLKEQWSEYRGVKGRKAIPVLEQGVKPIPLKLTPNESDLLNHRAFSVERICSMTNVPKYRVNQTEGSIAKGVLPELDESYMRNNLNPILVKIEAALNECLPEGVQIEFNRKAYYAGSPWRLVEHVAKEVSAGLATVNEGRIDLGRERDPDADVYALDSNNYTYGKWEDLKAIQEQINGRAANNGEQSNDNKD